MYPPNQSYDDEPSVLVVDDDLGNLVAFEAVLESLICRPVRALSGSDAVERTRDADFAAIIMDVRMPGLDGYAAASFIRQNPRSASTPILFVSDHDDLDVAQLTGLYGNTGHVDSLQKPFAPEILRAKITWWLELFHREQHVQALELAIHRAQAQARSKDDVLAMVAHDLSGALTAINLSTAKLRREAMGSGADSKLLGTVERHVELVRHNAHRMTMIVADLLDNVRIASGTLRLDVGLHAFEDIVAQAVDLLRPLAEQKSIEMVVRGDGSRSVACDRDRMLQVLSNLLGNALKFTPSTGRIEIEMTSLDDALVVCVRDTGPGIASDELPLVFQKYWQGRSEVARAGVGLGLAIAKEIVLAHQGRIWVASDPGAGSRFWFSMPCARVTQSPQVETPRDERPRVETLVSEPVA
ncbi:MAG TPA: hybrid sensor histidine kinase/response regulator [Polyangiaceae bacterium]